jgi:hypothetical protein
MAEEQDAGGSSCEAELRQLALLPATRWSGATALRLLQQGDAWSGHHANVVDSDDITDVVQAVCTGPLWADVQRATHGRPAQWAGSSPGRTQSFSDGSEHSRTGVSLQVALQVLVELHDLFDPAALEMKLPGCYNPRCTNLAGVSKAALPTKLCSGCKAAR